MTTYEYNALPPYLTAKCSEIASVLAAKNNKAYTFDIGTFIVIAELIIKIVKWFIEWRNAKQSKLTLLQRGLIWVTIRTSGLRGAKYSEVVDAIFDKLDERTFNVITERQLV